MITLTLLHPLREIAVQSWTFKDKSSVRLGRASDNEIVLYSAVVSRHHVEIRKTEQSWIVVNLGANGTYVDGEKITSVPVVDGMTFQLATSGPKISIKIESEAVRDIDLSDGSAKRLKLSRDTLNNQG